jgi:hypothetical protein
MVAAVQGVPEILFMWEELRYIVNKFQKPTCLFLPRKATETLQKKPLNTLKKPLFKMYLKSLEVLEKISISLKSPKIV